MAIAGELSLSEQEDDPQIPCGRNRHGDSVNTLVDLYNNHQQRIYRYCLSLLRNPDDAEDATQETFTRAAPFLPNLPGDLSAYLTTVARNICCDVVRARARRVVPIDNVPLTDRGVGPERQNVDWDVVRRMWRQLSASERLLFAYTFAGYKYEEIASRTGLSRPSVSVGLTRARKRLRDLAAATGTLGLLPVGIRRLLQRMGRRASAALQSTPSSIMAAVDQVGAVAVSLLTAGLVVFSASGSVAAPPMAAVAQREGTSVHAGPVAPVAMVDAPVAAGVRSRNAAPATPARRLTPPPATPTLAGTVTGALPGANATPQGSQLSGLVASPHYPGDHTAFVWGLADCPTVAPTSCDALWRTTDQGTTWSRLSYLNYPSGSVLLPPSYPADPAFLVVVPNVELAESSQGDGSFDWTAPGIVAAAIAPWSTPGNLQVAAVTDAGTVGFFQPGPNAATTPAQGPILPGGMRPAYIAYTGPGELLVSGQIAGLAQNVVTLCPLSGACGPLQTLAGSTGIGAVLSASPQVASDHLVLASEAFDLEVSRDSGASFHKVLSLPGSTYVDAATIGEGPAGPRIVVSYIGETAEQGPHVLVSDDGGTSFTDVTGNLDAVTPLLGVAAYADGTVLAGAQGTTASRNTFALRQSTGNGTWINPS